MMRLKIICLLVLCFFAVCISAQDEVVVSGKFYYKGLPYFGQINGRLGNNNFRSDSNGEFKIYQSADQSGAKMTIKGGWTVITPHDGYFPFTRDTNHVWEVHLEKGSEQSNIRLLIKKIDELRKESMDADKIKTELDQFKKEYLSEVDDKIILGIEQQVQLLESIRLENERRDSLLRSEQAAHMMAGKKKTLDLISSDMDHFISRALDVEDAFRLKGNDIFYDRNTQAEVAQRLIAYSEAYEQLNKDRTVLLNGVEAYWQDEFRTSEAQNLVDYALNDLHKLTMLTAQELIRDINCVTTKKEKKCPRKKSALKSDAERFNRELHYKIDILKDKRNQILQKLKYKEDN